MSSSAVASTSSVCSGSEALETARTGRSRSDRSLSTSPPPAEASPAALTVTSASEPCADPPEARAVGALLDSATGSCAAWVVIADMGDAVSALDVRSVAGLGGSLGGADGGDVAMCDFSFLEMGATLVLVWLEPARSLCAS